MLLEEDGEYFESFWTRPGYVGHDSPEHVRRDLIDVQNPVSRVLCARDLLQAPEFAGPQYGPLRTIAGLLASASNRFDLPIAIEVKDLGASEGYLQGAGVRMISGKAAGRQMYAMMACGDLLFCDGRRDANILRFADVIPGDRVQIVTSVQSSLHNTSIKPAPLS